MPAKKIAATQLSTTEQTQVQALFATYHQVSASLHASTSQADVENALHEITSASLSVQFAFIKLLATEQQTEAADILTGLYISVPQKDLRKEARRALLRLESTKIYPQWKAPTPQQPAVLTTTENPPRFWKGWITVSREQGEIQLILCWEQGNDYREIRTLMFLLDFWFTGVKDAINELLTKRQLEERLSQLRHALAETETVLAECTLAEGKRVLQEALAVATAHERPLPEDYRTAFPLINTLILQAEPADEDHHLAYISSDLEPQEVALNFIGAWSFGDFGLAYDLLTTNNELRTDLTRAEWISQHQAWQKEAQPARMQLGFTHEAEARASALWLPTSLVSRQPAQKEFEIGWSLELLTTQLSGTLKEMPLGTTVNKETNRHWFWNRYKLVRENDVWRIQDIKDEGLALQQVSIEDLQAQIKTHTNTIEAIAQQSQQSQSDDMQGMIDEVAWRLTITQHYFDTLITKLPLDYQVVNEVYNLAILAGNPERAVAYLERMTQRFSDQKNDNLRRLAATLVGLAHSYESADMQPRVLHLLARAETILREQITHEEHPDTYILLGELLLSEQKNDEAETFLRKASSFDLKPEQTVMLEAGLGNIAVRREQFLDAMVHYQHITQLDPDYPGIWFNLGFTQRHLGQLQEAEKSYQEAIRTEPDDRRAYTDLAAIYMQTERGQQARTLLEQALRHHPDDGYLHAILASTLAVLGEQRAAERTLDEAIRLGADPELVQRIRQQFRDTKKSRG